MVIKTVGGENGKNTLNALLTFKLNFFNLESSLVIDNGTSTTPMDCSIVVPWALVRNNFVMRALEELC